MKRFFWNLGIAGICGAIGCAETVRPAQIEFASDVVDLGVFDPGESDFDIPFRNSGAAPLRVGKVGSTCSCTSAEATPEVGPAGSGALRGKVKVQSGPGGADLTVATDSPGEPKKLRLRWFGKSNPTLLPDALAIRVKAGDAASCRVEASYAAGDPPIPLEFVGVMGLPDGSRAEIVENNPAAIRAIPGVSASPNSSPSPFVGKAKLRFDLPPTSTPGSSTYACTVKFRQRGKAIDLPFKMYVKVDEGLRAAPESLLFSAGDFEALKQVRRKVVLTSDAPGDRFEVVEKPAYLNVELAPKDVGSATRAILTASITAPPPSGEADGRLILQDSSGRRITVALYLGVGQ